MIITQSITFKKSALLKLIYWCVFSLYAVTEDTVKNQNHVFPETELAQSDIFNFPDGFIYKVNVLWC